MIRISVLFAYIAMNDDDFRIDNHVTNMNFCGVPVSDDMCKEICELEFENSSYETLFRLRYAEYVE